LAEAEAEKKRQKALKDQEMYEIPEAAEDREQTTMLPAP
jgi:hypothetical protein